MSLLSAPKCVGCGKSPRARRPAAGESYDVTEGLVKIGGSIVFGNDVYICAACTRTANAGFAKMANPPKAPGEGKPA